MIKTIEEIDDFFNSFTPSFGGGQLRENRLKRMELLLNKLGHPENSFSSYHIAGSKGKGTTASYLAKLIEQSGKKCGLYMSPHVYDIRERFTNATKFFSDSDYIKTSNELEESIRNFAFSEELGPKLPTTFELYTAYGYLLFKNTGCTEAVIETGLGGRLDATNTLKPKAVIFTNIELEHTEILGSTFEEIANEKLGIMRENVPTFYTQEKLYPLLEKHNSKYNCPLYFFKGEIDIEKGMVNHNPDYLEYQTNENTKLKIANESKIILFDALYACFIAKTLGILSNNEIIDLTDVNLPARFEKLYINNGTNKITIIFDGAHTPSSCHEALDSLKRFLANSYDKEIEPVLIFSAAEGKKIEEIGKDIFPFFKRIIISSLGKYKKSKPEEIELIARKIAPSSNITLNIDSKNAATNAIEEVAPNGCIIVLGSFYLCSEIKKALKELGYVD